jgi:hypothetical protein
MGVVKKIGQVSPAALEDHWQRQGTAAAIEAARKVVREGVISSGTPIGRLGDGEWGWIVAGILFAWISTRAQQATAENLDTEQTIRMTALNPQPWDAGAVMTILPELADACPTIDWSAPLSTWSREAMAEFLLTAMRLIQKATIARDLSEMGITRKSSANMIARQTNAAIGGPLMTPDEFDDEVSL